MGTFSESCVGLASFTLLFSLVQEWNCVITKRKNDGGQTQN